MISKNKKAFSMFIALAVIIMMSTVAILVVNVSGKIIQTTGDQYRKEQAVLLAKSYTELAIMAVMSNDRITQTCLTNINGIIGESSSKVDLGEGYRIATQISYIGNNALLGNCAGTALDSTVQTPSSAINILVDVYVRYRELDNLTSGWINYHRRTLQKI